MQWEWYALAQTPAREVKRPPNSGDASPHLLFCIWGSNDPESLHLICLPG
jgi:hypothetical protein